MSNVLLITGGSRGIGAATARLAAQRGYLTVITYLRHQAAAQAVVNEIRETGGRALAFQSDVSLEEEVVKLFEQIDAEAGQVSALVNNAGIVEQQMRVDQMDAARLQRIFATNIVGPILCAREAVRRMSTKYGGD